MKTCFRSWRAAIYFAITFFFSFADGAYGQFDSLGLNTKWVNGAIVFDDNSTRKGLVQFNDKLGMIKFRKTPDSAEDSFVETSVVAMQLFDEDTGTWRHFALFNVDDAQSGKRRALLFEVLMEFRKFALLTRVERVNVGVRTRYDATLRTPYTVKVGYEQFENLCLVDEDGNATVVLSVSEFERNKLSMASKLKPYLDKRALEKYLGDDWDQFLVLVKNNKLNLKRRDDFIRAFEYLRDAKQEG